MAVLVLSGNAYKTVSIVRSLGKKGIDVDVVGESKYAMSFYSKYCRNRYVIKSKDKEDWFKKLVWILKKNKYDLLIPQSEGDCIFLAKNKNRLPYNCLFLPPVKSMEIAYNKELTMKLAKKLGIPIPRTWFISDISQLEKIKLKFPVVIKSKLGGTRPTFVFDEKSFIKKYLEVHRISPFPIIQEVIIGDGYGTFALCKNGKVIQYFAHRRVREQDPKGSGSACCESVELDDKLKKYTDLVVKELNWSGVIMLEFKHDSLKNEFKLIEINGRFWGSLPLSIHAGVDFPYQLYRLSTGKSVEVVRKWKKVCAKYITGEIIRLSRVIKGRPKGWKLYFPNFFNDLMNYFKCRKCKYFVFDVKDPLPFFMDFVDRIYRGIKKQGVNIDKKKTRIPILMYHNFYETKSNGDHRSISLKRFEQHLKYLKKKSYETLTVSEKKFNSEKPIYLTFDDGYASQYNAFKLLKKYGFKGSFFVISENIGRDGYLNKDQLKEMSKGGMEIGSHTKTHTNLTNISHNERISELTESKKDIERSIGKEVHSISIPGGNYNTSVIKDCLLSGYEKIRTSDPDFILDTDEIVLPAVTITNYPFLGGLDFLLSRLGLELFQILKIIRKKNVKIDQRHIKGLFHVHSNYSHDGKLSLTEIKKLSIKNGYKFVILTDHAEDFDQKKWMKYVKECKKLSDEKFVFIPGMEISSYDGPHIILVNPKRYTNSKILTNVVEYVKKNKIFWGIAHIRESDWKILESIKEPPSFIEVWNSKYHGYSTSLSNLIRFRRFYRTSYHTIGICGNDIHDWKKRLISLYLEYEGELSYEKILNKIKNEKFICSYKSSVFFPNGEFYTSFNQFVKSCLFRKVKSNKPIRKLYHLIRR
ncbi:MAG: ATP-grasp domain-containing protein [Candidatus Aenigmarchaeota archaeon]|nr:ATP-grasp domain-containing protein [Candidatus Aenigmarchaeota archaeon]